jgi:ATP-dependent DNA helicase RecQ
VGIVYAATVKAAKEAHDLLSDAGESVTLYHGRLKAAERSENQELFMNGERRVMVATNAFGMGIDKSDTRFVVHLQVPGSLKPIIRNQAAPGAMARMPNARCCTTTTTPGCRSSS